MNTSGLECVYTVYEKGTKGKEGSRSGPRRKWNSYTPSGQSLPQEKDGYSCLAKPLKRIMYKSHQSVANLDRKYAYTTGILCFIYLVSIFSLPNFFSTISIPTGLVLVLIVLSTSLPLWYLSHKSTKRTVNLCWFLSYTEFI